jgi:hypothetical protein
MQRCQLFAAFLLLSAVPLTYAQATGCAAIQTAKRETYGFQPSLLSDAGRKTKSTAMDRFWNLVKSSGPSGIDCMRQLIVQ